MHIQRLRGACVVRSVVREDPRARLRLPKPVWAEHKTRPEPLEVNAHDAELRRGSERHRRIFIVSVRLRGGTDLLVFVFFSPPSPRKIHLISYMLKEQQRIVREFWWRQTADTPAGTCVFLIPSNQIFFNFFFRTFPPKKDSSHLKH